MGPFGRQNIGAQGRNRTTDTVIFSHVLYQLSYLGAARLRRRTRSAGYKCSVGRCPERAPSSPFPEGGYGEAVPEDSWQAGAAE